ncbi:hypothetical protein LIER_11725 [Lithospermum erythrorhizon]|uniref:Uncharacterized protein n=1 Tax=Lithospermum erythrorhizon TaxID=34254 RepID=A0AAV3PP67_LITER
MFQCVEEVRRGSLGNYVSTTQCLKGKHLTNLEKACRQRGYILRVWTLDSLHISSMVSIKRLKLLIGGMYKVKGTAEKATAKNNCNIEQEQR